MLKEADLPILSTADEVASLLRTKRRVIYEKARLGLFGITRIDRRLLFRRDRLLQFLRERESSVPLP